MERWEWRALVRRCSLYFDTKTPIGKPFFGFFDKAITKLIGFQIMEQTSYLEITLFLKVLRLEFCPLLIFFSALMSVFYIRFWNYTNRYHSLQKLCEEAWILVALRHLVLVQISLSVIKQNLLSL